jgi:hypothetical protein
MAAAGFTPVSLYYSTNSGTVPTAPNLVIGELAINVTDGKLFYKDTLGGVYVIANKTSATGNLPGGSVGSIVYQSAPATTAYLPLGTAGFILVAGSTTPTFTNPTSITVGNATLAARSTAIAGGSANQIPYQTAPNVTTFTPTPTVAGTVLSYNGTGFSWSAGVPSSTAANLLGGVAGSVPYQSATDTTVFAAVGTTGQVFTYNTGTNSPSWTTSTVTLGNTVANVNGSVVTTITGLTSVTVTQDPTSELQLATKQYVDNSVTAGIDIHAPVVANSTTNVSATYANGGTALTVTAITGGTTLTIASHGLSVDNQVVPSTTANGLVAGTPYYVQTVVGPNQITLSASIFGPEITTFTNGTGLSIGLTANSGVGATLTSTTNGPLVVSGYTGQLNDRILLSGQTAGLQNGVYVVSQVGVVSVSPWILTRATDANRFIPHNAQGLGEGSYFLVTGGEQAGSSYVCTNVGNIIFGTTAIVLTQFAQGGSSGGVSIGQVFFMANN